MIKLETFFINTFDNKNISTYRLLVFAAYHLQCLIANNVGGKYNNLITDLTNCLHNMQNDKGDFSFDLIMQKCSTLGLNILKKDIIKDIIIAESTVKVTFKNDNVVYNEFFSYGLTAWHDATRDGMTDNLVGFNKAIANHSADFKPAFIQKWNDYENNYTATHNIQITKKATVSKDRDSVKEQRINLEDQLMTNLYTLAIEYKRQKEKSRLFFNQSLLLVRHRKHADKETFEGELMPLDTIVITDEFENDTLFSITNNGDISFTVCFSDSKTDACTSGLVIDKGETKEITAHDLNCDDAEFIKITNNDNENKCEYHIVKVNKKEKK